MWYDRDEGKVFPVADQRRKIMNRTKSREKCRNRIHVRLYSRLMICNTVIFLIVAYIVAFIGLKYYVDFETLKKIQQSRTALNAVCSYYSLKQTALADIIIPFYQSEENQFNLDMLLRAPTDTDFHDPTNKKVIFDVFQRIADRDGDIKQILVYKNNNGSKFVYFRKDRTVEETGSAFPFFETMTKQDSGRIITGTQKLESMNGKSSDIVYGIGGVIGADKDAGVAGKFLITFNTVALERVFQGYSDNGVYGRFLLVTYSGDVVYDSDGAYSSEKFMYMDAIRSGTDTRSILIEGTACYLQTIPDEKAGIIGVNIVPKTVFEDRDFSLLIFGVITMMAIICAALYFVGGHFITHEE